MREHLKKAIEEELIKLPKEIQAIINSSGWDLQIEKIGQECLLTENEIGALQAETSLVLLGIQEPEIFKTRIENNIGLSTKEAEKINILVNEKVFSPIFKEVEEKLKDLNLPEKEIDTEKENKENWEHNIDYILRGEN
jgi:hypothetical protein